MKSCPACGTQYPNHVAFCFRDGHPLVAVAAAPAAAPPAVAESPLTLEGWTLEQAIGGGLSAVVYKAVDAAGEAWALHVLAPSLHDRVQSREAFLARAALMERVPGEVLVPVRRVLRREGVSATLTELLQGVDLERAAPSLRRRPALVADLGARVALALGALHRAAPPQPSTVLPIHGLLSPRRILLSGDGAVHVLGGGFVPASLPAPLPGHNAIYAFLAPEQIDRAPLDARTDIYTLCLVLYTLVVGHNPRLRPDIERTLRAARDSAPAIPSDADGELELALHALLREGLDPDPYRRPSSVEELAMSLRALPGLPGPAELASGWATALGEAFAAAQDPAPVAPASPPLWLEREELEDRVWSSSPRGPGRPAPVKVEGLGAGPLHLAAPAAAPAAPPPAVAPTPEAAPRALEAAGPPSAAPGVSWPTEPELPERASSEPAELQGWPAPDAPPPTQAPAGEPDGLAPGAELLVQATLPEAPVPEVGPAAELAPDPVDAPIAEPELSPATPAEPALEASHPAPPAPTGDEALADETLDSWGAPPVPPAAAPPPRRTGWGVYVAVAVVLGLAVAIWAATRPAPAPGLPPAPPSPALQAPALAPAPPPTPPPVAPTPPEEPAAPVEPVGAEALTPAAPAQPAPPAAAPSPAPSPGLAPGAKPPTPPLEGGAARPTPPAQPARPAAQPKPAEDDPWGTGAPPAPAPAPQPTPAPSEDNPWG